MNHHFKYLLRLADNSLINAQCLCKWTGHGPFLEEDLALTNIALDILGRSKLLLEHAALIEGNGNSDDGLAFHRSEREYLNTKLVEQPTPDYAFTIIKQVIIDSFDLNLYKELAGSKDEVLAGIAAKSIKEITYHYRHSSSWVNRFGLGTEESNYRAQNALNELWRFTGELTETDETDEWAVKNEIGFSVEKFKASWQSQLKNLFNESNLIIPENTFMQTGGKNGIHTEHLGYILAEMQTLPKAHTGATW